MRKERQLGRITYHGGFVPYACGPAKSGRVDTCGIEFNGMGGGGGPFDPTPNPEGNI